MTTNFYRHSHTKHTEENKISEKRNMKKNILQKLSLSKKITHSPLPLMEN